MKRSPMQRLQHGEEGIEEAPLVDDDDGARIEAEALPGDGFEQLLQGAAPAGERDDRVGPLDHGPLPLVHVGDELQLRETEGAPTRGPP